MAESYDNELGMKGVRLHLMVSRRNCRNARDNLTTGNALVTGFRKSAQSNTVALWGDILTGPQEVKLVVKGKDYISWTGARLVVLRWKEINEEIR